MATRAARPWVRAAVGLLVGVGIAVALMFYLGVSQREVVRKLQHPTLWPLLFAAAGSLVLLGFQALRWWTVMRPILRLSYFQAYRAMAVGFLFNALLPARAGDLLRVQYLGKRTGVSRAKLLGTEIVDFFSDKWGWVASFPVICLLGAPPTWLFRALLVLGGVLLGGAGILVLMGSPWWRTKEDGTPRGPAWLHNLREGFAAQHWKRLFWVETVLAPLPWLWETAVIMVAGRAVGLSLSPMQAFAVLTAFNLAMVVTSPANMGSFESGGTLALVQFQVPSSTALAFIFLYHLTQVLPSVAAGALILVIEKESLLGRRSLLRSTESINY